MIQYPSLEEALELHKVLIQHFGGSHGIRDKGLLESALYRPQTGYYEDIVQMATALLESLLLNHPFVDGNKRMAFFLTDTFLRMNGGKIQVQAKSGYDFLIGVIESEGGRFAKIEQWLRNHLVKM